MDYKEELINFLIEAKKETYANESIKKSESSRKGSNDYEYAKEIEGKGYTYHDTYFGGLKFIGEEVVYIRDTTIWGMNYYGVTLDKDFSEEAIDKALRPALMKVGEDLSIVPVRGPSEYKNGEYKYTFSSTGAIDSFTGVEKIYKNDKLIYHLYCHGGSIK